MKKLISVIILTAAFIAVADQITPSATLVEAVRAAHSNNEAKFLNIINMKSIAGSPCHPYTKKELIDLFKKIKVDEIKFSDLNDEPMLIYMVEPMNILFEAAEIKKSEENPRDTTYRIINVCP